MTTSRRILCASAYACCFAGMSAHAADGSWAVNSGGNWGVSNNWAGAVVAGGAGYTATFDLAITAARTVTNNAARAIGNIVVGNASAFNGAYWRLDGSSLLTLDNAGAAPALTVWPLLAAGNSACELYTPLSSPSGFAKRGGGTLWLWSSNALAGAVSVEAGRVFCNNAYGFGSAAVVVSNGCYVSFYPGAARTFANAITLNGFSLPQDGQSKAAVFGDNNQSTTLSGTLTLNATSDIGSTASSTGGGSLTLSGLVTGPGGLVKTGPGKLSLSRAVNTYAGGTVVSNGLLSVASTNSLGAPASVSNLLTVAAGATFDLNGQRLSDSYKESAGYTVTIAGHGSSSRYTNTYGAVFGAVVSAAGVLDNKGLPNLRLAGDASIGNNGSQKFYIMGRISGPYALTKVGSNSAVLGGANGFAPEVTALIVSNGEFTTSALLGSAPVRVCGPGTFGLFAGQTTFTNALWLGDGSTWAKSNLDAIWSGPVAVAGAATVNVSSNASGSVLAVPGAVSGVGALVKKGSGTLVLSGTNSFAGAACVSNGVLRLAHALALPSGADVAISAGGRLDLPFAGTLAVRRVTVDGVLQTAGRTYGAASLPAYLSGPGALCPADGEPEKGAVVHIF